MPDCKEEYKWCKGEPFVYKDEQGKDYCVFHAPKGRKGVSLDGFNNRVFARINHAILNKQLCYLSGTLFEGDIGFNVYNKDNPLPGITFFKTTFSGEVDFSNVTFSETVGFSNAKFSGNAWFVLAKFSGKANFLDVTFSEEALFPGAVFSGEADFSNATFAKDRNAWFSNAKFNEEVFFSGATFSKDADFSNATFSEDADFSFTIFSGEANFSLVKFKDGAYFYGGTFKSGTDEKDIDTVVFEKGAKFQNFYAKEKIRFEGVNLEEVSFLDSDLRNCDFIECKLQRQGERRLLYDEVALFDKKDMGIWEKLKKWWLGPNPENGKKIRKIETLYRRLKQKYIDEHDWPKVSNWHYGEKEMFRHRGSFKHPFPFIISNLYWLFGGYGERPVRAGLWLGVFILGISVLMGFMSFEPSPESYGYEGIIEKWVAYLINTLQYVTFQKETIFTPASLWAHFVALFARVVIPLQAALFVLAVRNRFRR